MTTQERFDKIFLAYRKAEREQVKRKLKLNLLKIKIIAGFGSSIEQDEKPD